MPSSSFSKFFQRTRSIVRKIKSQVEERSRVVEFPVPPLPSDEKVPAKSIVHIEVSSGTVAKVVLVIIGLVTLAYFVTMISDILVVFFVAFLLAAAMEPTIDSLNKRRIPRGVAVIFFYLIAFVVIGFIVSSIVPILAQQVSELAVSLGVYLKGLAQGKSSLPLPNRFQPYVTQFLSSINVHGLAGQVESDLQALAGQLLTLGGNIWDVIKVISHGFINTVLVLVLAYFMVTERHAVDSFLFAFVPVRHEEHVAAKIQLVQKKIGFWLRGMLIMMLSMGVIVYIGLLIFGIKYAAVLAIIAGLMELVPVAGPVIAWAVAVPIVLNQSSLAIVSVTFLYFIAQQFEGHVLVPVVMKRIVGLNPIIILFALLVGARFLGVLGAVLSVPVATMLHIFLHDYFGGSKRSGKGG